MQKYVVKDLMVPLSEYATVSEKATLFDAVSTLEKAQEDFDHTRYRHRAVLVLDDHGKVIGKLSQLDVLKALEPKYDEMLDRRRLRSFGFTKDFMKSMLKEYQLFDSPLEDICRKAGEQNVKKFMYSLSEGEYIAADATLDEAIHQFVLGHHQSLLVTRGEDILGILRLTDVFAAVYHTMKECF
jgi:CBS domain-containing protein